MAELSSDAREDDEPGSTFVLTPEGWQSAEYLEPADDWTLRDDGSFESPDGTMRTWTPADPAGG
jgi:hypothetical protein